MNDWKSSTGDSEEDILDMLKNDAEDDHRNYIYPKDAQSILDLLVEKDRQIRELQEKVDGAEV